MKNKTLLQVRTRYFIYTLLCVVFWSLYISGLYIMWSDNEMGLFMNYIFTAFGLVGMLWLNMIFHEKFVENYT
jgi:hypothetical protein